MPRRAYLSPQFRNLRTEQIGPSSHKNEFRSGVLVGNWAEERLPRQAGSMPGSVPDSTLPPIGTTYGSQFADKSKQVPTLTMGRVPDMGGQLLFGHSATSKADKKLADQAPQTKTIDRFQAKRRQWQEENDPDAMNVTTTKKAEMDRVGEMVQRDPSVLTATHAKGSKGGFVSTFVREHQNTGLRTPYPIQNTPLRNL